MFSQLPLLNCLAKLMEVIYTCGIHRLGTWHFEHSVMVGATHLSSSADLFAYQESVWLFPEMFIPLACYLLFNETADQLVNRKRYRIVVCTKSKLSAL